MRSLSAVNRSAWSMGGSEPSKARRDSVPKLDGDDTFHVELKTQAPEGDAEPP